MHTIGQNRNVAFENSGGFEFGSPRYLEGLDEFTKQF